MNANWIFWMLLGIFWLLLGIVTVLVPTTNAVALMCFGFASLHGQMGVRK